MRLRLSAAEAVQTAQHLIFGEAGVPAATAATPLRLAGTSGFTPAAPLPARGGSSSRSSRSRTAAGDGGDAPGDKSVLGPLPRACPIGHPHGCASGDLHSEHGCNSLTQLSGRLSSTAQG